MIDLWTESAEKDECPECEHPWYLHNDACCVQRLCSCNKGKRALWALPPEEYAREAERVRTAPSAVDSWPSHDR